VTKLPKLPSPAKIQDFINKLTFNHERKGETHRPALLALKHKEAHCFEGALIAAAALQKLGHKPLLLDLVADEPDFDHVVALFKVGGHWGAISKTNHAVLRYRDPVYKSVRELAMSYFNEYFLYNGTKTMKSFSKPFDLTKFDRVWVNSEEDLAWLAHKLDASPHTDILTSKQKKNLRKADKIERQVFDVVEYKV
jgi:hypothetical protein